MAILKANGKILRANGKILRDNGNFPDGLVSLFYGDYVLESNTYKYRAVNEEFISGEANWYNASKITESLKENTPLGNIVVFCANNTNNLWNCRAIFKQGVRASNFTFDYWLKYENPNPWGERTQICQLNFELDNGSLSWFINGPYSNWGIYYNGGSGGMNFDCRVNIPFDNSWHHLEFDVDIEHHNLIVYIDGMYKKTISLSQKVGMLSQNGFFREVFALNDNKNNPNTKYTQVAFWNKLMNGTCYSKGLYHDGDKFLI